MIKVYRKTGTIKAEQFDGSAEMIERHSIRVEEGFAMKEGEVINTTVYWLPVSTLPGEPFEMKIMFGDWIVIDEYGEVSIISNDDFTHDFFADFYQE